MKLKRWDYIIVGTLIILTIASSAAAFVSSMRKFDEIFVNIEVDGKFYKKVPLNNRSEKIKVETSFGTNIIEIVDGKVHVDEADCPDKICIKDGFIRNPGQILVCLPNRVAVQVVGEGEQTEIDDTAF